MTDEPIVVVAHPDDECIFAGALLMTNRARPFRIVIVCYEEDSERAGESKHFAQRLGLLGMSLSLTFLGHDDVMRHPTGGVDAARLETQLRELGVDGSSEVYCHNSGGEYGHAAHVSVGEIVRRIGSPRQFDVGGGLTFRDEETLRLKRELFAQCYPSQQIVWRSLKALMHRVMFKCERHGSGVVDELR